MGNPPIEFLDKLKSIDVRVRKSAKKKLQMFSRNPDEPELNNHALRDKYAGCRSIDITADYRAIYVEKSVVNEEVVVYFFLFGTHKELYGQQVVDK